MNLIKKIVMILAIVFIALGALSMSQAQGVLQLNWQVLGNTNSWLTSGPTGTDLNRGLAYNPVTDHILVTSRVGYTQIRLLNPTDGTEIINSRTTTQGTSVSTTGISGGTFILSKIGVADDGAIYGASLQVGNGVNHIYKWATETSDPILFVNDTPAQRTGDGFRVVGSGVNTRIYISGSANTTVRIYDSTGALAAVATSTVASFARQAIGPVAGGAGANFYAKGASQDTISGPGTGQNFMSLYSPTGTFMDSIATTVIDIGGSAAQYVSSTILGFAAPTTARNLLLTNNQFISFPPVYGLVVDVTSGDASAVLLARTFSTAIQSFGGASNGTFEVAFDTLRQRFVTLTENNNVASWGPTLTPTSVDKSYWMNYEW